MRKNGEYDEGKEQEERMNDEKGKKILEENERRSEGKDNMARMKNELQT